MTSKGSIEKVYVCQRHYLQNEQRTTPRKQDAIIAVCSTAQKANEIAENPWDFDEDDSADDYEIQVIELKLNELQN
jgi:hypothetical protein